MKTELTAEQVVRVLAARQGRKRGHYFCTGCNTLVKDGAVSSGGFHMSGSTACGSPVESGLPPYLTSRDALQPILEGLSDAEWSRLHNVIYELSGCDGLQQRKMAHYCLTAPARDLAFAIAAVLQNK